MSTVSRALPRPRSTSRLTTGLLTAALIAAGLCAASSASAAGCTAGTWVARSNEAGMPAVRYETTHFAFRWNGDGVSSADVRAAGEHLEMVWDTFINRLQFPEPACTSTTKYKASIHLDPGFGLSGGVTGSGNMGMWMAPGGLRDHWGLAHELTHALQGQTLSLRDSDFTGWIWESHANWMTHQLPEFHSSDVHCSSMLSMLEESEPTRLTSGPSWSRSGISSLTNLVRRAWAQLRLPVMVLISPLWAR